ncbi:MMPL family transporter [Neisseria dentiae]|uniref:MMPL family transporter n=1 Tax=Neisseria dentiae TaxID=194197 RepID=UPI00359F57A7
MHLTIRRIYTALMVLLLGFAVYSVAATQWLQTDLTALLPQEERPDVLLQAADRAVEAQLNTQVVLLAGSADAEKAFQTASEIAALWRKSQVFAAVDSSVSPDLEAVRADVRRLGLAVLPPEQRQLLFEEPKRYFQERAEAAVNPFAAPSPLPLEQDWLGFGRFVTERAQPQSRLQWNADNGMLFTEDDSGKTWVWLRGKLPETNNLANGSDNLLPLLQQSRELAAKNGVETLSAGGAVFAAASKADAERESKLMSTAGLLLTFALLLWVFRSARVFWLTLPLAAGMLAGLAAALLVFGEVHILTIVIGTSLVGMLVDFPLHWLAPSVFGTAAHRYALSDGPGWQAEPAMRHVLPTFAVSLLITVAGYAFLWFTPLPVLRQTAVFSGFALLGAFGATVLWLPPLFARYQAKSVPFTGLVERLYSLSARMKIRLHRRGWWLVGGILLAVGLWRSNWHDDIRQWVNMPPAMLAEAQKIGELSGTDFGSRYLVVEAGSEDELLRKNAEVGRALQPLAAQQKLAGIQSLDQWLLPAAEQQKLQNRLRELAKLPENWQPMREIGVPRQTVRNALNQAAATPPLTLSDGLKPALAEAWRPLYLGEAAPGRFASIIRLNGLNDAAAVQAGIKGLAGVHWADKRSHLNELFHHTRNQAAWLKLASYALALLLLWRMFGIKRGITVLAVPLAAAVATVAVLGWVGIPVSLFAMFGLLLVSAIGVDYAVYAVAAKHIAPARLGGMLLAALTTGISFVLLGMSSTPAVAAFGITVAVGTVLNLWLAGWLLEEK